MKKRICIDIRICQKGSRYTGTGIYAYHLSRKLHELETDSDFEFWYLVLKNKPLPWAIPEERIIRVMRPSSPESVQELFDPIDIRFLLNNKRISLFHSPVPGFMRPSGNIPVVVTIHDLIPEVLPQEVQSSGWARWLYRNKMKAAVKASHVSVDSDATGIDLIERYPGTKGRITTVYLGSQFEEGNRNQVRNRTTRPWKRNYMLYLGGFNYRKNVGAILTAFAAVKDQFQEVDLLIAGKPSSQQGSELMELAASLKLGDRVQWLGFMPDERLPEFYAWCNLFVYPSLYEGFGIPVLEAMQFGAPVVTSNRSSIPEIIGSAGILVNPDSVDEIRSAIVNVLGSGEISSRMSREGEERFNLFSWERCANETMNIYKKVLKQA